MFIQSDGLLLTIIHSRYVLNAIIFRAMIFIAMTYRVTKILTTINVKYGLVIHCTGQDFGITIKFKCNKSNVSINYQVFLISPIT